ncbi:MAG: tetratricopeptide repeat protein [Planctomycetota bacterium]
MTLSRCWALLFAVSVFSWVTFSTQTSLNSSQVWAQTEEEAPQESEEPSEPAEDPQEKTKPDESAPESSEDESPKKGDSKDQDKDTDEQDPSVKKDEPKPSSKKNTPQKKDGTEDLNKAFDLKLEYRTTRDLDRIAQLCENAMRKGLNKKDMEQAKELGATTAFEFADQLAKRIFKTSELDIRWQYYRSQALPRLKQAVDYDDSMVSAYILLAKLESLPGGDRESARKAIDRALELATESNAQKSDALYVRALMNKDADKKIKDLNQAIEINPNNLSALKIRAAYFISNDKPRKALKDFRAWLAAQPDNYEARIVAAESLIELDEEQFDDELQDATLSFLDEAIELKPDLTVPYTFKAQVFTISEDYEQVVEAADLALKFEPKNVKALKLRATALADLGQYEKAVDDADQVIKLQGLSLEGVQLRGVIRVQQGNFEKAVEDFETLSNANPSNSSLKQQLAALYNANDEPSKGIRIYTSLLRRVRESVWKDQEPDVQSAIMLQRVDLLVGRGDCRLSTGEHDKAIEDYGDAIELMDAINEVQKENDLDVTPVDDTLLNNFAWVLATSPDDDVRDAEKSIELATRAAEMTDFEEAHILSTLASGYAESGDFDTAIEYVEKALAVNRRLNEEAVDKSATEKQFKSLNKELDSYQEKKPWRERQDVENEKKEDEKDSGDESDEDKPDADADDGGSKTKDDN